MNTPLDQDPAVRAAIQDHTDAVGLLGDLEGRVVQGDPTVTPRDLAEQRELIDFAELLIDTTREKVEQARAEDRQRRYREFGDELATFTAGTADVEAALLEATTALRKLLDTGETRYQRMKELSVRGSALREEARTHGEEADLKNAGVWAADPSNGLIYREEGSNGELTYRRRIFIRPAHLAALSIRNAIVGHNLDQGRTHMEWPEVSSVAGRQAAREFPTAAGPSIPGHANWPGQ